MNFYLQQDDFKSQDTSFSSFFGGGAPMFPHMMSSKQMESHGQPQQVLHPGHDFAH